jgi:uncharacterized protein (DUF58 family)
MFEFDRQSLLEGERAGSRYALAAPRTIASAMSGLQMGGRAGSSLEFREHRDYQPGDDLRRIDWNAFARSDRLTVKLYREEISPHLDLVLDGSRSMALAESEKMKAALGLSAALAVAAANAGFTHNAWLARERCAPVANGKNRPSAWNGIEFDFQGNVAESIGRAPLRLHRQGMRALISDLLWLGEPLVVLQRLSQSASAVIVIQVLARADVDPPERGRVRLVDSETEEQREIFIDAAAIERYREALERHQENWRRACRQSGAVMLTLVAEQLVEDWNLSELVKAEILKL